MGFSRADLQEMPVAEAFIFLQWWQNDKRKSVRRVRKGLRKGTIMATYDFGLND